MTNWEAFKARLNERSTWATVYAVTMASMPGIMSLDFPFNLIAFLAAFLGAFVPDGKVIAPKAPVA